MVFNRHLSIFYVILMLLGALQGCLDEMPGPRPALPQASPGEMAFEVMEFNASQAKICTAKRISTIQPHKQKIIDLFDLLAQAIPADAIQPLSNDQIQQIQDGVFDEQFRVATKWLKNLRSDPNAIARLTQLKDYPEELQTILGRALYREQSWLAYPGLGLSAARNWALLWALKSHIWNLPALPAPKLSAVQLEALQAALGSTEFPTVAKIFFELHGMNEQNGCVAPELTTWTVDDVGAHLAAIIDFLENKRSGAPAILELLKAVTQK